MNCKNDSVKLNKNQHIKKSIILTICILFIASLLLSTAFIFTHINHEHDHNASDGGCATCAQLTEAENLLKLLSTASASAALVFGFFSAICSIIKPVTFHADLFTLVHLKVRLNN